MIKIDLITGFLGAGKTTFIKKYAKYLVDKGLDIGILENDFGAVNVDAMLLQDILGDHCSLEMVAGGCDADCHRRRFKTKLIAMGMCGYNRVLVEPSGIFDMDEFFDALHEDPLDRWYEIGNVITIIDAGLDTSLSDASRYILASQAAQAGAVLYSHTDEVTSDKLTQTTNYVADSLKMLKCSQHPNQLVIKKDLNALQECDFNAIESSGYYPADYTKLWSDDENTFDSLCFMNVRLSKEALLKSCEKILNDVACGNVMRIKGFKQLPNGQWISINITHQGTDICQVQNGQEVIIVIGEELNKDSINKYLTSSEQ